MENSRGHTQQSCRFHRAARKKRPVPVDHRPGRRLEGLRRGCRCGCPLPCQSRSLHGTRPGSTAAPAAEKPPGRSTQAPRRCRRQPGTPEALAVQSNSRRRACALRRPFFYDGWSAGHSHRLDGRRRNRAGCALRVPSKLQLTKLGGLRVESHDAPNQWLAVTHEDLQRLVRL